IPILAARQGSASTGQCAQIEGIGCPRQGPALGVDCAPDYRSQSSATSRRSSIWPDLEIGGPGQTVLPADTRGGGYPARGGVPWRLPKLSLCTTVDPGGCRSCRW